MKYRSEQIGWPSPDSFRLTFQEAYEETLREAMEKGLREDALEAQRHAYEAGRSEADPEGVKLVALNAIATRFSPLVAGFVSAELDKVRDSDTTRLVISMLIRYRPIHEFRSNSSVHIGREVMNQKWEYLRELELRRELDKEREKYTPTIFENLGELYEPARRGWARGVAAGYRDGAFSGLHHLIKEKFGEEPADAADEIVRKGFDYIKLGAFAGLMIETTAPAGVTYWAESIAEMNSEEIEAPPFLPQMTSDPVSEGTLGEWPWQHLSGTSE